MASHRKPLLIIVAALCAALVSACSGTRTIPGSANKASLSQFVPRMHTAFTTNCSETFYKFGNVMTFYNKSALSGIYYAPQTYEFGAQEVPVTTGVGQPMQWVVEAEVLSASGTVLADSGTQVFTTYQGAYPTIPITVNYNLCDMGQVVVADELYDENWNDQNIGGQANDVITPGPTPVPTPTPSPTSYGLIQHCVLNKTGTGYICTQTHTSLNPSVFTFGTETNSTPTPAPTREPTPKPCLHQPCPQ